MVEWPSKEHYFNSKCCCCGALKQGESDASGSQSKQTLSSTVFLDGFICDFCGLQVFNWRVVDCDLAIGLCTLLSKAEVFKILWKVIDNTWQNYDKILVGSIEFLSQFNSSLHQWPNQPLPFDYFQAVARIGANLCCLYDEAGEQMRFLSVITDAEWGIKLGKLEVSW